MDFMATMISVLALLMLGTALRVVLGPTAWDRLLGFNLVATKIVIGIVLLALVSGRSYLLDVAIVYSLIGFVATVLISRFIEQKDRV